MECRICHQPIVFVRGRFPHRSKTTTLAVHESESASLLQHPNSFLTNPHPGAQRKLRQALEEEHNADTAKNNHPRAIESESPVEHAQPEPVYAQPNSEPSAESPPENSEEKASERALAATNTFD
jgi:hypothetical protein